jgi:hypothetical protein
MNQVVDDVGARPSRRPAGGPAQLVGRAHQRRQVDRADERWVGDNVGPHAYPLQDGRGEIAHADAVAAADVVGLAGLPPVGERQVRGCDVLDVEIVPNRLPVPDRHRPRAVPPSFQRAPHERRQEEVRCLAWPRVIEAPRRHHSHPVSARELEGTHLLRRLARGVDTERALPRTLREREVVGPMAAVLLAAPDDDDDRVERPGGATLGDGREQADRAEDIDLVRLARVGGSRRNEGDTREVEDRVRPRGLERRADVGPSAHVRGEPPDPPALGVV